MPITDLYSTRQKKFRGETSDVYSYDELPGGLRNQICQILADALRGCYDSVWESIVKPLRREYGVPYLLNDMREISGYEDELMAFINEEQDIDKVLDAVEVSFRFLDEEMRDGYFQINETEAAIEELNHRFKQRGVGYQFHPPHVIRVDSELLHAEVVNPALRLLDQARYAGAQEEFLKAHEQYRKKEAKEALNNCLKAFESLMKAICTQRNWSIDKNATAKTLIKTCLDNGLIPTFWQSHYASLRSLLESSVPTGRNKLGGHGQGSQPVAVPDHLVAYMLHMTAAAIVFLAEAEEALV